MLKKLLETKATAILEQKEAAERMKENKVKQKMKKQ